MKILFVTRRSEERARLQREAAIRAEEEGLERLATALRKSGRARAERHDRLMAAIWAAHDAGLLPYELDCLLLNEWSDDRPETAAAQPADTDQADTVSVDDDIADSWVGLPGGGTRLLPPQQQP